MQVKQFENKDTFGAFYEAQESMRGQGYSVGSMCRDAPIALTKGDTHVAKWRNIDFEDWYKIDGLIVSKDFREGNVAVILFEDKERYNPKADYYKLIKNK